MQNQSDITCDTLLRGRVKLLQPRQGFRSSLDPVLLSGFVAPPYGSFLDIGCASGALSFLLLARDPASSGVGVEIQPRLAGLAQQGASANGFADRFAVVTGDVRARNVVASGAFDLVAINPPFRALGTGVLPPLSEKALANHEVALALGEWLDVAALALRETGRVAAIFPFDRWDELRAGLSRRGLSVARFRPVTAKADEPPRRMLVEARKGAVDALAEPPLVVHAQGGYSPEVRRMLGEEA